MRGDDEGLFDYEYSADAWTTEISASIDHACHQRPDRQRRVRTAA